jgi:hypothetical protein
MKRCMAGICKGQRGTKHVASATKRPNVNDSCIKNSLDVRACISRNASASERHPTARQLIVCTETNTSAAAQVGCIISPHENAVEVLLFRWGAALPAELNCIHVLLVGKRLQVPLLRTLRINGYGMDVDVLGCLIFERRPSRVRPIGRNRQVSVVLCIQELCALIIVVKTQADEFVWMDFADIKGELLLVKVLTVVQNVEGNRLLRATSWQTVQGQARSECIAKVELLAYTDIRS